MIEQVQKIVPPAMKLDGAPSRIMTGWILVYNPQHGLIQLGPPGRRVTWNGENKLYVHRGAASKDDVAHSISARLIACTGWSATQLPTNTGELHWKFEVHQIQINAGFEITIGLVGSAGQVMFSVPAAAYELLDLDFVMTVAALTGHAVTYQPHKPGKPMAFRFTS